MEQITIIQSADGTYSSEIGVSVEEWQSILLNKDITTSNYKEALMAFYKEPGHGATCSELGDKYFSQGKDAQKFNSWITQFGKAVSKHLNRFKLLRANGKECFWNIPMNPGKDLPNGKFQWTLRKELIQAIENLGWNELSWIPFYMEFADKLLEYKDNRKELTEIIYGLGRYVDYIKAMDGGHVNDIDPFSVYAIFNRGLKEENRIEILDYFKGKFNIKSKLPNNFDGVPIVNNQKATFYWKERIDTDIQPLWDFFEAVLSDDRLRITELFDIVQKQRGVKWNLTMGIFWIRPYQYIALDSKNRAYLPTIGIGVFDEKDLNSYSYFKLLDNVFKKMDNREIREKNIPEISINAWLANDIQNIWLVGYSIDGEISQYDRFIEESVWEGTFKDNVNADKKSLELVKTFKKGDAIILKSTSTRGVKHDQPFLRVKTIGIATSDIELIRKEDSTFCKCAVDYIYTKSKDFDGASYGSYRKAIHELKPEHQELRDYIYSILGRETMKTSKYDKYIELLRANKNLVLTGAPGTGKTFMAQKIAEEMGAEIQFVQFHPSYDYTDFVEGLRPINDGATNQIGFERKDGVFKEFCKKAVQNLINSQKSKDVLEKEQSWQDRLQQFANDAIENNTVFELTNKGKFTIVEIKESSIIVNNKDNVKTQNVVVNTNEIIDLLMNNVPLDNVHDIRIHFGRKFGTQPDSYAYIITKKLREMGKTEFSSGVDIITKKDYVFIIDEINRGEASKIFGELFYAIDPGYRGKKDIRVQTQYQNLVPSADVFAEGFYVPENVYILATMNDIDRSVESMDFAMRRRFTWKEVTPIETQDMLDELEPSIVSEAKERMNRLNAVIAETEGLGEAYMIGASYFLKLKESKCSFDLLWSLNLEPLLREYLRGFRGAKEILKALSNAYFGINENVAEGVEVEDED